MVEDLDKTYRRVEESQVPLRKNPKSHKSYEKSRKNVTLGPY